MSVGPWTTRPVEPGDWEAWQRLFAGYCEFYGRETSEAHFRRVWSWIHDEQKVHAIVGVPRDGEGEPIGLAHLRPWVRPLRAEVSGYLDDLFIAPEVRGTGVFEALFAAIDDLARRQGWTLVRWTTATDNHRAQGAYDRVATRTGWVTYDMPIE